MFLNFLADLLSFITGNFNSNIQFVTKNSDFLIKNDKSNSNPE